MAKLTVHGGNFENNPGNSVTGGVLHLRGRGRFSAECISARQIEELDIASVASVKRIGGTLAWGALGGALLGPLGFLAGVLTGGQGTDVTFVARLRDGRWLLATTRQGAFTALQAGCLAAARGAPAPVDETLDPWHSLDATAHAVLDGYNYGVYKHHRDTMARDEYDWPTAQARLIELINNRR